MDRAPRRSRNPPRRTRRRARRRSARQRRSLRTRRPRTPLRPPHLPSQRPSHNPRGRAVRDMRSTSSETECRLRPTTSLRAERGRGDLLALPLLQAIRRAPAECLPRACSGETIGDASTSRVGARASHGVRRRSTDPSAGATCASRAAGPHLRRRRGGSGDRGRRGRPARRRGAAHLARPARRLRSPHLQSRTGPRRAGDAALPHHVRAARR